ncbi:MAG: B12-binding domain-containing radical SAM protein, partial [Desulfobacterales bacterium]|nr:B12-binding domain-containing radical SAM protein [Desulfobacterales bacterium]
SARVLRSYTMEQLIGLGIGWVWMGLEGQQSKYAKLSGIDTRELVSDLQANGIRVLGSSIIGLEEHTPENIDAVIDYAVSHKSVFHQFMLYTPIPGTPLYEQHRQAGTLFSEAKMPTADTHGQYRFNYKHRHIPEGREETYLMNAFNRDFEINGPSLARLIRILLTGWQKYKQHPKSRIRKRFEFEAAGLKSSWAGAVWAMRRKYQHDPKLFSELSDLLKDIYREFGWKTRLIAPVVGRCLLVTMKLEESRLAAGWTLEPGCFYEKNQAALKLDEKPRVQPVRAPGKIEWVGGAPSPAGSLKG